MTEALDARLVAAAVAELDAILERHALGFVHLDRGDLIQRLERIREAALTARLILTERRHIEGAP
jgi:hypothetical protein